VRDRDFEAKIPGIERPWIVDDVVVMMRPKTVEAGPRFESTLDNLPEAEVKIVFDNSMS
jgi:hypothetical protein